MEAKVAKNIVRVTKQVLQEFEKIDQSGTISFILRWFGLIIRYLLMIIVLVHMNIMYVVWFIAIKFGNYNEKNPSKYHILFVH